jgi:cytosine/adenosine deaminase-related metal-dependent hydrolase
LENHFINVVDGVVDSVTAKPAQRTVFDFGSECQILPGTVNAHTHLELSGLPAPLDVPAVAGLRSMAAWIPPLMQFRRSELYNAENAVAAAFLRQEVLSESVAVADIVPLTLNIQNVPAPKIPVWLPFGELIAWKKEQVKEKMTEASRCRLTGVSPHAPQTVCPELLEAVIQRNVPVAMHLAESPEELELLQTGGGGALFGVMKNADPDYEPKNVLLGKRPLDYLQLLAHSPQAFIIHGNYLDDEELRFLAAHRETLSVVYCPRSHHYFGFQKYPLKKMLDFGVRVLLGTDSLASSPDLSIVNEMRFTLREHPEIPVETVFRFGTLDAAAAFGLNDRFGTIQAGRPARFAFLTGR